MKKQAKTKPTVAPQDDTQLQTRVLLEDIRSDVKIVGEQHGSIIKRLDNIDAKLSRHDEELQIIKTTVRANSSELKSVKLAVNELDAKTNKLDVKVSALDIRMGNVESRLDSVDNRLGKIENKLDTTVTGHEHRLQKIEAVR